MGNVLVDGLKQARARHIHPHSAHHHAAHGCRHGADIPAAMADELRRKKGKRGKKIKSNPLEAHSGWDGLRRKTWAEMEMKHLSVPRGS
jgi:hypothetical protein